MSAFGHIDKVNSCITATSVSLPKCTWVIQWRLHMYAPNTCLSILGCAFKPCTTGVHVIINPFFF